MKTLVLVIVSLLAIGGTAFTKDNQSPLHFHGYGELHYGNSDMEGSTDTMDNHRLVLGWTYDYNDRIKLNVEVDFEHAAKEMELEFAYIDFLINGAFNLRAGTMLMPIGYLNEFHEPPRFFSVERPYVQKNIIPTTWQEGGVGIFGTLMEGVRYRLYVINGLDASGFTAGSGIRKGRGKGAESPSEDLAVAGRFEYDRLRGLRIGVSAYNGGASQGDKSLGDAGLSIVEADARYRWNYLELSGLYTNISVNDTESIHAVTGQVIGDTIDGGYIEAAYHLGGMVMPENMDLILFARREDYNTQKNVAQGFTANPANDVSIITVGVSFMPVKNVAVKADMESWEDGSGKSWRQINAGLGYMF